MENKHQITLGFHTKKDKSMLKSLQKDFKLLKQYNFRPAAQIFTQVPFTGVFSKLEEPHEIINFLKHNDMDLCIHTPYVINDFWKKNDLTKLNKSLLNASQYVSDNFRGIVVHLPKLLPEQVADVISKRLHNDVLLLLENHSYIAGDDSYELPEKLNKLTKLLNKNELKNHIETD